MSKNQYIKNDFKIIFIIAWFMGLFILDTAILLLVGHIVDLSNHQLLFSFLIFILILLAQTPIQWKALRNWFPSEKSFYDLLVITITLIMALIGLCMVFIAAILYFLFSGPSENRQAFVEFPSQCPRADLEYKSSDKQLQSPPLSYPSKIPCPSNFLRPNTRHQTGLVLPA
jgi:hypothetical protein